jgi:DNA-binding response OmpR family regulator
MPPSGANPSPADPARLPQPARAAWLVLASGGAAADLPALVVGPAIRVTPDPRRFRDVLLAERPRIVVVCQPPAGNADLEVVAAERRRRPRLRVLHLAPPDAVAERMAALALGFDDALTTATTGPELAGRLTWLEARARDRPPTGGTLPVADGLELDLVAHELRRGDGTVHVRPKEFGLLALMASHPGRAYTRRELLERVWGHGHESWLRSKIEPDPDRPIHLVTVRGVGYRLDPPER